MTNILATHLGNYNIRTSKLEHRTCLTWNTEPFSIPRKSNLKVTVFFLIDRHCTVHSRKLCLPYFASIFLVPSESPICVLRGKDYYLAAGCIEVELVMHLRYIDKCN